MKVTDYFAELYVAGRFADAGWNIYFPHRDKGFDFIASKETKSGEYLIRPIQVKGKYPTAEKGNKSVYGYVGGLTQLHPEMVLAIPFFSNQAPGVPTCVAYMPRSLIRKHSRGFKSQPASFRDGVPAPRRDYAKFFDDGGLVLLEDTEYKNNRVGLVSAA
jgi:hypothetical protein